MDRNSRAWIFAGGITLTLLAGIFIGPYILAFGIWTQVWTNSCSQYGLMSPGYSLNLNVMDNGSQSYPLDPVILCQTSNGTLVWHIAGN